MPDRATETEATSARADGSPVNAAAADAPPTLPDTRFVPGTVLAGRYRIVSLIGRGGMGEVYRADDLKLGQQVALKFLPESIEDPSESVGRFFNEVKIARQIAHPNVCRVYDVGEVDGLQFLSMEFIDGEDLETLLRRIGRLPHDKAVEVGQQVCRGLAAAHEIGILHRDLKPANLMVDRQGITKVTDFGLSGLARSFADHEIRHGTPAYMAPEQHAGEAVSSKSDLYALGLVLYKVFTGQSAFEATSLAELAQMHRQSAPTPPSRWVEELHPAVERIILRCLEKDPRHRPPSALAVAAALPTGPAPGPAAARKTLLLREFVDATPWEEKLGAGVARRLRHLHDQIARHLMTKYEGRELGPADASLLVFDRPVSAVRYALAYHQALAELGEGEEVLARIALHLGELSLTGETTTRAGGETRDDTASEMGGSAAIETLVRLAPLAEGRQTLVTRSAFDQARQSSIEDFEKVRWLAHGSYEIAGMSEPLEIFEVGVEAFAPLRPPQQSDSVRRRLVQSVISGWRPAPGLELPQRTNWEVVKKLGEGGFGEVWLARQKKTHERRVFKFCYDAGSLRALQREITLFRLLKEELGDRHDITRILDWNFDEPPYFIESDYTVGGSLVDWVRERGGLDQVPLDMRIEIVAQVATALAAAHSVGVLHKDVKPSNVLITTDAEDRVRSQLSDFGIGHVTEKRRLEDAGITAAGLTEPLPVSSDRYPISQIHGGTRLYMAPELLEGKPATLQADIYALGVMLYQMVVGDFSRALAPGWDREVADELLAEDIASAVDGSAERRLSSALRLANRLRGLDERRRRRAEEERERAEAAQAKAALARSRKLFRYVAVVMVVLAVVAASAWISTVQIKQERDKAEQSAEIARQVSDFLESLFQSSTPEVSRGESITAQQLLEAGASRIDELEDPETQARLALTIGRAYESLGIYDAAIRLIEKSLSLRRSTMGDESFETAESLNALASAWRESGGHETSERHARSALAIRRQLAAGSSDPAALLAVAESLDTLAGTLYLRKKLAEAEAEYLKALEIYQSLEQDVPAEAEHRNNLAFLYMSIKEYDKAELHLNTAIDMSRRFHGEEHPRVADLLFTLALLHREQGDFETARRVLRQSLEMSKRLRGEKHPRVLAALRNLGEVLKEQGEWASAEEAYREALGLALLSQQADHPLVASIVNQLKDLLILQGKEADAELLSQETLQVQDQN